MVETGSLIVVSMVTPGNVQKSFRRKRLDWPLHVTLIQWFTMSKQAQFDLMTDLHAFAENFQPVQLEVGQDANFGINGETAVSLVSDDGTLRKWHFSLLDLVEKNQGYIASEKARWTADGYQPHATHHGAERLYPGDTITFNNFSVIALKDDDMCELVEVIPVGGVNEATA